MEDHAVSLARSARVRLAVVVAAAAMAAACSPPTPRSYDFFLLDSIARDGTLARCDRDPAAAQTDIECHNARRAALAVQLEAEREHREALERESAAKIEALRREYEAQRLARAAEAQAEDAAAQGDEAASQAGQDAAQAGEMRAEAQEIAEQAEGIAEQFGEARPDLAQSPALPPESLPRSGAGTTSDSTGTIEPGVTGAEAASAVPVTAEAGETAPAREIPRAFRAPD